MKKLSAKIINFIKEVKLEVKKINWPDKRETLRYTFIVIGVSVAVAFFLGGLDFIFTNLLEKFLL